MKYLGELMFTTRFIDYINLFVLIKILFLLTSTKVQLQQNSFRRKIVLLGKVCLIFITLRIFFQLLTNFIGKLKVT